MIYYYDIALIINFLFVLTLFNDYLKLKKYGLDAFRPKDLTIIKNKNPKNRTELIKEWIKTRIDKGESLEEFIKRHENK